MKTQNSYVRVMLRLKKNFSYQMALYLASHYLRCNHMILDHENRNNQIYSSPLIKVLRLFTLGACSCSAETGQITRRPTSLIGQFIDVALRPLQMRTVTRLSYSSVLFLSTKHLRQNYKTNVLTLKYILVLQCV